MEQAPLHLDISSAPENGVAYWTSAADGVQLRIGLWKPERNSRGTVLIFPGRGDYIELYGNLITDLERAGYSALIVEWRGHGLSGRIATNPKVGHVEHFSDYQQDVAAMTAAAQQLDLPQPWYLVGHSMGACIALRSLINGLDVEATAFTTPMFDIHMASYERIAARPLTWAMQAIGKGQVYAPGFNDQSYVFRNKFEANTLTNSSENYERWIMQGRTVPELHTGGPSMSWLYAALQETRSLSKLPSPDIPCVSLCGDQEETVGVPAIRERMSRWPQGKFEIVANAKHELFLETSDVRQAVMAKILGLFAEKPGNRKAS